jgi:glycosyltransferase involved in cell wall biosynthesis
VCVSEYVKRDFSSIYPTLSDLCVLYNTNETAQIIEKSAEDAPIRQDVFTWCGVGKLLTSKGFDRMIRIQKRLTDEGYSTHFYALGEGPQRNALEAMVKDLGCEESVTFLGYQTNPYKYVAKCDLFVCASHAEGFSTAATEALIVGTPVCTVEVSGMKEMLGEHNEYGIVTENDDEALYQGIKKLLDNPELLEHYRKQAALRGKDFRTEETVKAVEQMLLAL